MTTTHLRPRAHCMRCDWTPDPDARASVDSQAAKHTKEAGHPTTSGGSPEVRR